MANQLKIFNSTKLKSKKGAKVNFPLLYPHPSRGLIRTNGRKNQTYDQIAIFAQDKRLTDYKANETAGMLGWEDYDYGAFRYTDLIAWALFGADSYDGLKEKNKIYIIARVERDISDHMPVGFDYRSPVRSNCRHCEWELSVQDEVTSLN